MDSVAKATLCLAIVTVFAIVIPIWREDKRRKSENLMIVRQAIYLFTSLGLSLAAIKNSPNLDASGGVDLIASRLLSVELANALTGDLTFRVTEAVAVSMNALHNADVRANALLMNNGVVQEQARKAILLVDPVIEQLNQYLATMPLYKLAALS